MKFKDKIIKWWNTSSGTRIIGGREAYCHLYKGQYHNSNGPAIVYENGSFEYFQYGIKHRQDGPAYVDYRYGNKCTSEELKGYREEWWYDGELHRIDGPAISFHYNYYPISALNEPKWYYKGNLIKCGSQREFERIIKLLIFC